MIKLLFYGALLIFPLDLKCQHLLTFNMGSATAISNTYVFSTGDSVLSENYDYLNNYPAIFRLNYRFGKNLGIELNYQHMKSVISVHDKKYIKDNNLLQQTADQLSIKNKDKNAPFPTGFFQSTRHYSAPGAALYINTPVYSDTPRRQWFGFSSLYIALGVRLNMLHGSETAVNSYYDSKKNEELKLLTNFSKQYISSYLQLGFTMIEDRFLFYSNMTFTFAGKTSQSQYSDATDGNVVNSDRFTTLGHYFVIEVGVGYAIWQQREKHVKIEKRQVKPDTAETQVIVAHKDEEPIKEPVKEPDKPVKEPDTPQKEPDRPVKDLSSRKIDTAGTMEVTGERIAIEVWDDGIVDGDVISLNLNGKWILVNYILETEKELISVSLQPGENRLVLYAEGQGRFKPCTAALLIIDKQREQRITLNANFQKSAALILKTGE